MAGTLVSSVIDNFQAMRFSECGDTLALQLLNIVMRYLGRSENVRQTTADINLTSGTREYDLSNNYLRVKQAILFQSAATQIVLRATSEAEEDSVSRATDPDFPQGLSTGTPLWRTSTQTGTPDRFYITAKDDGDSAENKIGFLQTPDTTTTGGYPYVKLYVDAVVELATDDRLPDTLHTDEVVLDWMAELYAKKWAKDQYPYWRERRIESHADFLKHSQNKTSVRPSIRPGIFGKTTTI